MKTSQPVYLLLTYLLLACLATLATGCGSQRLTRERVAGLLADAPLAQRTRSINLPETYNPSLPFVGETPEKETAFALHAFYESYPELRVLDHVGDADFAVTGVEYPDSVMSDCTILVTLTPRGLSVVSDSIQQPGGRRIELARREVVEVTGITGGEGESKQARAEFTWKWVPTETGRYFDVSSAEHKGLPAEVRGGFGGGSLLSVMQRRMSPKLFDSSAIQKGTVELERYDDGWRLVGQ